MKKFNVILSIVTGIAIGMVSLLSQGQNGQGSYNTSGGNITSNQLPSGVVFKDSATNQVITQSPTAQGGFLNIGDWNLMPNTGGVGASPNQPRWTFGGNSNLTANTADWGPQIGSPGVGVFSRGLFTDINTNRLGFGTTAVQTNANGVVIYGGPNGDNWGSIGIENGSGLPLNGIGVFQLVNNGQGPIAIAQSFSLGGIFGDYEYYVVSNSFSHFTLFQPGIIGIGGPTNSTDVMTIRHDSPHQAVTVNAPLTVTSGDITQTGSGNLSFANSIFINSVNGTITLAGGESINWNNANVGSGAQLTFKDGNANQYATWQNAASGINSLTVTNNLTVNGTIIPSAGSFIRTNFISGFVYTNLTGAPIIVSTKATLTVAAVAGNSVMALEMVGNETNQSGMSTLVTSIAMTYTNVLSGIVTNNGTYTFTNRSTGVGNSSSVLGGQIIVY